MRARPDPTISYFALRDKSSLQSHDVAKCHMPLQMAAWNIPPYNVGVLRTNVRSSCDSSRSPYSPSTFEQGQVHVPASTSRNYRSHPSFVRLF